MANVRVYRTQSGDTWDLIAYRVYRSEGYYHDLVRSNLALIDIAVFDANVPIILPEIAEESNNDTSLPPWKRGE
ncbi:phage Tail Protein X [Leptotrichia hongkongensis]|jgi:phage tail protein X|uniref:Phage Tail Protein X n=1 Tax=Leptotrichia hongkongensis TaxID=554406 RepID=A0A510L8K1_9FUSO|nr:tail protein X [Leptotrichia hongkongensis]BBM60106.1 phage Tail Protein X [Leptotrichia hongkongensis]